MNNFSKAGLSLLLLTSPVSFLQAATPQAGINFSGNIELDTDMTTTENTDTAYTSGGRTKLQIDGRRDNGEYFVAGKGELLALVDGTTVAEDAWLMLGKTGNWNVRVGRYENEHMFPEGRDTVIVHATNVASGNAPVPYEMDAVRGRSNNGLRLRIQSVENMMLELGTFYGGGTNEELFGGIRPVVVYDAGGDVTFRVGMEVLDNGVSDLSGFGGSVGFKLGEASLNVNLTSLDDTINALESTTVGINVAFNSFVLGLYDVSTDYDAGTDPTLSTIYGSYSHMVDGLEGTHITYAFSSSSADKVDVGSDDQVTAVRVRLNYEF